MITIKKIEEVTMTEDKKKNAKVDIFAFYIGRPISYLFTIPFLYTNIKPNTITWISVIFVILGTIFSSLPGSALFTLFGWLSFFLRNIFDGVDGNVARYKKQFSENGSVMDAMAGYLAMYFTFFAYGIAAYNNCGYITSLLNIPPIVYVLLGSFSGFSLIFPRLVMHKKKSSSLSKDVSEVQDKSNFGFLKKVALNLTSIAGFVQVFMLIICVLAFFDILAFDIFTIIYCFINAMFMVASLFKILK